LSRIKNTSNSNSDGRVYNNVSCCPYSYKTDNSSATNDDGSCIYSGCTDSTATNYNSLATIDDVSCIFGLIGVWTTTNVIIDSTITVTVGGVLDPTQSGSGSETKTAEDAEAPTSVEFLSNGTVYALHSYDPAEDDTSTYSISGSTLTITSPDEDPMDFEYTVDKTTLTLVMSIDTSVSMPPVEISASFSQTLNFNRE
jgi:hypothetical protein